LTLELYAVTKSFPQDQRFGPVSQIRRAAHSIGSNLAEGCGRQTDRELGRYVQIAMGSASELDYHLMILVDLGYLSADHGKSLMQNLSEIRRMLTGLWQSVISSAAS
jgi:four helix bundle protein